jgi:hypothetical protein
MEASDELGERRAVDWDGHHTPHARRIKALVLVWRSAASVPRPITITTSSCAPPPFLFLSSASLAPRSASSAPRRAGSATRSSRPARRSRLLRATCVPSLCAMYDLLTRARTDDQGRHELHVLGAVRHQAELHRVPVGRVPEQQRARGRDLPQARGQPAGHQHRHAHSK